MRTDKICEEIRAFHRQRLFLSNQRQRLYAALGAYIRVYLGWRPDLPKAEADAIKKNALALIALGVKDAKGKAIKTTPAYDDLQLQILATVQSASIFEDEEAGVVKTLEALASSLPVWTTFGESIRGFGPLSLAVIIGEAGDLANYSSVAKLWKRLGLAVIDGVRQGGLPAGSPAESWVEHGYNKARRSRMYVIGDVLVKVNGRDGRYRGYYDSRKKREHAKAREEGLTIAPSAKIPAKRRSEFRSEIVVHRRAQRYMEQRLIRDLWRVWRRCEVELAVPLARAA